jgi:hypothetical protein
MDGDLRIGGFYHDARCKTNATRLYQQVPNGLAGRFSFTRRH